MRNALWWEREPAQRLEIAGQAGGAVVDVVWAGGQQLPCLVQVAGQGFLASPRAPGGGAQCAVGRVVQVAQALILIQPGLMPSQPWPISARKACERAAPMASSRCPYGPAQEQP